ncbi:hypothetical protein SAMN06265222_107124 [Neorhodopirellula lusitana]|uniref:Reticulon-like protein n=1 Tax=Neorhodopirellula lusitana TaxID=445327 RepID=A0ABY1Q6Y6_9BACT|nr:hypothetical protein [Neorhodopirellula lusitana]SMP61610.1 hypothetical protein SAMN06265222_107124 [Neorhodopirellula lusitana]
MSATTNLTPNNTLGGPDPNTLGEPDAHVATRHMRTVVKSALIVALVATALLFVFYRQAAYLAAIPVPLLYGFLVLLNLMERGSRASHLRKEGQTTLGQEEIDADIDTIGVFTVLKVLGVLAVGTFIIAASLFDMQMVGLVATAGFLLAVLIQLPFLPLYFSEAERDERAKLAAQQGRTENRD